VRAPAARLGAALLLAAPLAAAAQTVLADGPGGPIVKEGVNARAAEVKARGRCSDPQCQVIAWACTR
jgi:hypothetical protein